MTLEKSLKEEYLYMEIGKQPVQPERLVRAEVRGREARNVLRKWGPIQFA